MKTRIKSNSEVIVSAMIQRGLRPRDVTKMTGINKFLLSRLTRADRGISIGTAGKLVAVFGADAVTIAPAAQEG